MAGSIRGYRFWTDSSLISVNVNRFRFQNHLRLTDSVVQPGPMNARIVKAVMPQAPTYHPEPQHFRRVCDDIGPFAYPFAAVSTKPDVNGGGEERTHQNGLRLPLICQFFHQRPPYLRPSCNCGGRKGTIRVKMVTTLSQFQA
ncbi:unnamed protein product [Tetraodon nigroviridis]|uniref:(spotted green pufferfish) hypothetical protein n=1 Tax=Tetraodon nigroviridis TaxID=99883 RepID=Q4SJI6_TETNG|nr:unnamed protein product [Tetraodon nigroviridis]